MPSDRFQYITKTNSYYNSHIKQLDQKAAIIFSGHLAFIGLFYRAISDYDISGVSAESILPVLTLLLSILSVSFVLSVVKPRFKNGYETDAMLGNLNWKEVDKENPKEYIDDVSSNDSTEDGMENLIICNHVLAQILVLKQTRLSMALYASFLTVVLASATALL